MDVALQELADIVRAAEALGAQPVVIGAFALRTYLPVPDVRVTSDADLLIRSSDRPTLERVLRERAYRVYQSGPWLRAERNAGDRVIVDVALDAIVDLASFQRYEIDVDSCAVRSEIGGPAFRTPSLEDLVAQKLISAREKDLLDVAIALGTGSLDAARLAAKVEARDLEIPVARGLLELRAALDSGRLAQLWHERTAEDLPPLAEPLATLHTALGAHR